MGETACRVVWQAELGYAVEVTEPDRTHRVTTPFKRQADARAWIAEQKWKDAMGASKEQPPAPKKPG